MTIVKNESGGFIGKVNYPETGETRYVIINVPDIPNEANTYYDTLANLKKVINTTWGKIPHSIREYHDEAEQLTHIEVIGTEKGSVLHQFILERAEQYPLLPEHL